MNFEDPGRIVEKMDMDEHQMVLNCLVHALGTEKVYEITMQTIAVLRENNREWAVDILEQAVKKMILSCKL